MVVAVPDDPGRPMRDAWIYRTSAGAATLGLLAAAAIEGGRHGSPPALPVLLLVTGPPALSHSCSSSALRPQPCFRSSYFRNRAYARPTPAGLIMGFVMFSLLFIFALYFQQLLGDSPLAGRPELHPAVRRIRDHRSTDRASISPYGPSRSDGRRPCPDRPRPLFAATTVSPQRIRRGVAGVPDIGIGYGITSTRWPPRC